MAILLAAVAAVATVTRTETSWFASRPRQDSAQKWKLPFKFRNNTDGNSWRHSVVKCSCNRRKCAMNAPSQPETSGRVKVKTSVLPKQTFVPQTKGSQTILLVPLPPPSNPFGLDLILWTGSFVDAVPWGKKCYFIPTLFIYLLMRVNL